MTIDHDAITKIVAPNGYGKGVYPNPYAAKQSEWKRRKDNREIIDALTLKIEMLMEPRFITPPETSELIESLITISDSRKILEVGTCTGFTTLHMARAVVGKHGAKIVSVDARPAHDNDFWRGISVLEHVEGWTPQILSDERITRNAPYDLVFVDSYHSIEHTAKELEALWPITQPKTIFCFHDLPEWKSPQAPVPPPIRTWLYDQVSQGHFYGVIMPSCEQMDCAAMWGEGYPKACNPGLGIFIRR